MAAIRPVEYQLVWQYPKLYHRRHSADGIFMEQSIDGHVFYQSSHNTAEKPAKGDVSSSDFTKQFVADWGREDPHNVHFRFPDYLNVAGFRLPASPHDFATSQKPSSEIRTVLDSSKQRPVLSNKGGLLQISVEGVEPLFWRGLPTLKQLRRNLQAAAASDADVQRELALARRVVENPARVTIRWLVDPARGFAITAREQLKEGKLVARSSFGQLFEVRAGLWMPHECTCELFTLPTLDGDVYDEPIFVQKYAVSSFSAGPFPDSQFVLEPRGRGTYVSDGTIPGYRGMLRYYQPATLDELDRVIREARKHARSQRSWFSASSWLICACLMGVVFGVVVTWVRRTDF
jgi:hypothetical protein